MCEGMKKVWMTEDHILKSKQSLENFGHEERAIRNLLCLKHTKMKSVCECIVYGKQKRQNKQKYADSILIFCSLTWKTNVCCSTHLKIIDFFCGSL